MKNKQGFTLIELVMVISIVALLLMAIGLTSGVKENARVHAAAESVNTLRAAAESYIASGNMTYSGIAMESLQTAGYLPNSFNATGSNPWGGDYSIIANSDSSMVDISLTGVSTTNASRLSALFANSASQTSYTSDTWTATF